MNEAETKKAVRKGYAGIVKESGSSCCGGKKQIAKGISQVAGYSEKELESVPDGANLGLGCGNPVALASLKKGETVLDLGAGAGFDCFLASDRVGAGGRVIGVDMTAEMIDRARENAGKGNYKNVEFRLGEIENLPVADNYVDAIISNCVINLSPDKKRVFSESFRVLKPGGRLMVSDIVLLRELPENIKNSIEAYVGCISGATRKEDYLKTIESAGFKEVRIEDETTFPLECMVNDPSVQTIIENMKVSKEQLKGLADAILSIRVHGVKPAVNRTKKS